MTQEQISTICENFLRKLEESESSPYENKAILSSFRMLIQSILGPDATLLADLNELEDMFQRASVAYTNGHLKALIQAFENLNQFGLIDFLRTKGSLYYISKETIEELSKIQTTNLDLGRLIQLCKEVNLGYYHGALYSVAFLLRAILDHVAPVFKLNTFSEVANNYGEAGTSFKKSMQHLDSGARNIADMYLHSKITTKNQLLTSAQVAYGPQLELLLREIIRKLS